MWPAAPPTSAPLMQPLASAVTVCAVSRSAAVTAANTNFMRISLLGRLLNETRQREVPTSPTIHFLCGRLSPERDYIRQKVGDSQPDCAGPGESCTINSQGPSPVSYRARRSCGLRRLSTYDFADSAWL